VDVEGPLAFIAFLALAALFGEADAVVADAQAFFAALGCGMAGMSALA
jgi:hypothetical protein